MLAAWGTLAAPAALACGPGCVAAENAKPGTPPSEWDVAGAGDPAIQGFATDISVNQGETVSSRSTRTPPLPPRHLPARLLRRRRRAPRSRPSTPSARSADAAGLPHDAADRPRRLRQLGGVGVRGPCRRDAVSGIYFAQARARRTRGGASHIVVRRPRRRRPLRPALPDLGHDLAGLQPVRRQQPLHRRSPAPAAPTRSATTARSPPGRTTSAEDWLFNAEYPMVRWLERNGYDVSYTTGVDTRPPRRASCSSTRCSCRSATTSTGPASSGPTWRRPATPA